MESFDVSNKVVDKSSKCELYLFLEEVHNIMGKAFQSNYLM